MTIIHEGRKYDETNCTDIAQRDHYHNGNYAGSSHLIQANDGTYIVLTRSNGEDLYIHNNIHILSPLYAARWLDGLNLTEKETAAAVAAGLITVAD